MIKPRQCQKFLAYENLLIKEYPTSESKSIATCFGVILGSSDELICSCLPRLSRIPGIQPPELVQVCRTEPQRNSSFLTPGEEGSNPQEVDHTEVGGMKGTEEIKD